ncbi:hypothetical protein [Streptomyces sp. NPDC001401]|uniref:hypothetical protein n=1 Tax=Streptomyces sp. NPDC001401 TaxID=3364570 RepID=UPI00367CCFB6
MTHVRRLLVSLRPAATENSIPLVLLAQTHLLSCLAVKVRWGAAAMSSLAAVSAACGPVVPEKVWWGVVAGAITDGSVFSYQRFRRR